MQLANKKGWLRIGDLALYFYCDVVWRLNIMERSCFWSVHFHIGSTFQRVCWPVLFSSRVTVWDQNYSDMSGIYRHHDREVHELLNFFYSSLFSVQHAPTWADRDNLHLSFALLSVSGDIVKRFFGRTDAPMVQWSDGGVVWRGASTIMIAQILLALWLVVFGIWNYGAVQVLHRSYTLPTRM